MEASSKTLISGLPPVTLAERLIQNPETETWIWKWCGHNCRGLEVSHRDMHRNQGLCYSAQGNSSRHTHTHTEGEQGRCREVGVGGGTGNMGVNMRMMSPWQQVTVTNTWQISWQLSQKEKKKETSLTEHTHGCFSSFQWKQKQSCRLHTRS